MHASASARSKILSTLGADSYGPVNGEHRLRFAFFSKSKSCVQLGPEISKNVAINRRMELLLGVLVSSRASYDTVSKRNMRGQKKHAR